LQLSKADRYTPTGRADINNLLDRVRKHVASVLQKYGARLALELDQSLPTLNLNQIAVEQAMVNLISNAAQSSASEIAIKTERRGSHARITISDNGVGIAPEEIEHVFDPFYTTRRSQGDSGLGLILVHRIISDHDDTTKARSVLAEGTQFVVHLPLPQEEDDHTPSRSHNQR
jgi:two-component system NtrC family sensor kinase